MTFDTFYLFVFISFFYVISPGPAVFLAISNGMLESKKFVLLSTVGNITGLLLISIISNLGIGTLLLSSSKAFLSMKIIGAGYLIFLGSKQIYNSFKNNKTNNTHTNKKHKQRSNSAYFLEGFILASTNPKAILFFIAFFPQFIDNDLSITPQLIIMTITFMALSFISLSSYGLLANKLRVLLNTGNKLDIFHRITGGFFIIIGIGLLKVNRQ